MRKFLKRATAAALGAAGITVWWAASLHASDHSESPLVQADAAQDITDVYVFGDSEKTTIIVCWAGLSVDPDHKQGLGEPPSAAGLYDPAALYTIHVDTNADGVAEHKIYWRYGQNGAGATGIQWTGVPGSEGAFVHAVESVYQDASGARTWSGHADDPFFFDAEGYLMTLDTGTAMFDSSRDLLAGKNVTAVAIEMDNAALGGGAMQFWITSAYK